jgi:hypothetical protein
VGGRVTDRMNELFKELLEDIMWEDWDEAAKDYEELARLLSEGCSEPAWMTVISEFIH